MDLQFRSHRAKGLTAVSVVAVFVGVYRAHRGLLLGQARFPRDRGLSVHHDRTLTISPAALALA